MFGDGTHFLVFRNRAYYACTKNSKFYPSLTIVQKMMEIPVLLGALPYYVRLLRSMDPMRHLSPITPNEASVPHNSCIRLKPYFAQKHNFMHKSTVQRSYGSEDDGNTGPTRSFVPYYVRLLRSMDPMRHLSPITPAQLYAL